LDALIGYIVGPRRNRLADNSVDSLARCNRHLLDWTQIAMQNHLKDCVPLRRLGMAVTGGRVRGRRGVSVQVSKVKVVS